MATFLYNSDSTHIITIIAIVFFKQIGQKGCATCRTRSGVIDVMLLLKFLSSPILSTSAAKLIASLFSSAVLQAITVTSLASAITWSATCISVSKLRKARIAACSSSSPSKIFCRPTWRHRMCCGSLHLWPGKHTRLHSAAIPQPHRTPGEGLYNASFRC